MSYDFFFSFSTEYNKRSIKKIVKNKNAIVSFRARYLKTLLERNVISSETGVALFKDDEIVRYQRAFALKLPCAQNATPLSKPFTFTLLCDQYTQNFYIWWVTMPDNIIYLFINIISLIIDVFVLFIDVCRCMHNPICINQKWKEKILGKKIVLKTL